MKPAVIRQAVVTYLAEYHAPFKGMLPSERYFLIKCKEDLDFSRKTYIVWGCLFDVIAHAIEQRYFFSPKVYHSLENLFDCGNAKISPLKEGDKISDHFTIRIENGACIVSEKAPRREYLDIIRTPESFRHFAELMGIEGDLAKIILELYNPPKTS